MVASQELEPASGWDYTVMGQMSGASVQQMACLLAQGYYDKNSTEYSETTVSVIDLSETEPLVPMIEGLASDLQGCDIATLLPSRGTVYGFGAAGRSGGASDLVDLQDFYQVMQPFAQSCGSMEDFTENLQSAVVLSDSQDEDVCGLSLYAPYAELDDAAEKLISYRSLDVLPVYEELAVSMADYLLKWKNEAQESLPLQSSGEEITTVDPGNIRKVYLTLWEQDENQPDYYYLVGTDSDVTREGESFVASTGNEWTFLDGQPLCTIELESPTGLYTQFACPVLYEGQCANLILQYDAQYPYGRVVCLIPLEDSSFSRQKIILKGGESFTPLYPVEAFTETEETEIPNYLTAVDNYKVGEAIHYTAGMEPEALPAAQSSLYGFWLITWENQDLYSDFLAVS